MNEIYFENNVKDFNEYVLNPSKAFIEKM